MHFFPETAIINFGMRVACDIKQLDYYLHCVQAFAKLSISIYDKNCKLLLSVRCDEKAGGKDQQEIADFLKATLSMKKFNMRLGNDGEVMAAKAVFVKDELFGFVLLDNFHYSEKANPYCDDYYDGLIVYSAVRLQYAITIIELGLNQYVHEVKKPDSKHKDYGEKIKKYIKENLDKRLTLQNLCDEFKLSHGQINRIFREELEQSFQAYIREARLEKAKELLLSTDLPVSEIAKQVGHPGHALFDKLFKKYVGCTPTEYRAVAANK